MKGSARVESTRRCWPDRKPRHRRGFFWPMCHMRRMGFSTPVTRSPETASSPPRDLCRSAGRAYIRSIHTGDGFMKKMSSKWHAISIVLHETSCAAAAQCRSKRFLSTQIPALPLRDCDRAAGCQCKYKHYDDRRATIRRSDDVHRDLRSEFRESNRRATRGRRAVDSR